MRAAAAPTPTALVDLRKSRIASIAPYEKLLCQLLNVWPMLFHELACLVDHFNYESLGLLGVTVSSQQCEVRRLHAVVGITPRPRPDVLALSKAGCDEYLEAMFDLVLVPSN